MKSWAIALGKTAVSYALMYLAALITTHFQGGDFWHWFGVMIPGMLFVAYLESENRKHGDAETNHS